MRALRRLGVLAVVLAGCSGARSDGAATRSTVGAAGSGCAPGVPARAFRGAISHRLGDARHTAGDVVAAMGVPFEVVGKFQYGRVLKDLEGEEVTLLVSDAPCGPWTAVGTRVTDGDGRVAFAMPGLDRAARRWFQLVVHGDGSRAAGEVRVVAPGTPAVLFDVDGTLTTDDGELFDELLGGTAEVRPGAAAAVQRWAERGHMIVYVTGRPYALRESTRRWLDANGFPAGVLITPEGWRDAVPSRAQVGAFKRARVAALLAAGLSIEAAYGNAATDVCAYAEAGLEPARTWITGSHPPPCPPFPPPRALPSYLDHPPAMPAR